MQHRVSWCGKVHMSCASTGLVLHRGKVPDKMFKCNRQPIYLVLDACIHILNLAAAVFVSGGASQIRGDFVVLALGHFCWMTGRLGWNQCETVVAKLVALLGCHASWEEDVAGHQGQWWWSCLKFYVVHHPTPAACRAQTRPTRPACSLWAATS